MGESNESLVKKEVGYLNVDVLSGWETGLKGKERIAGKLYTRRAPPHLVGDRRADWLIGRDAAERYRSSVLLKTTHFCGEKGNGEKVKIRRKGWVSRGPVIAQMEQMGCRGDVWVYQFQGGEIKHEIRCGI